MKLTPWYSGDQKPMPDRIGLYERDYEDDESSYCWWNGRNFGPAFSTVDECASIRMAFGPSLEQDLPWRGVKK